MYYQTRDYGRKGSVVAAISAIDIALWDIAGKYFNKIECFCFQETELMANETKIMPVSFFIDPEIENDKYISDLSEVTLSYTFYENSDT